MSRITISQSKKIFLSCLFIRAILSIFKSYLLASVRSKFYPILFATQTAHVSVQCQHYLSLSCHSFVTGQLICVTFDWHYFSEYCTKIILISIYHFFLSRSKFSVVNPNGVIVRNTGTVTSDALSLCFTNEVPTTL